ncbi:hypothetical protein J5N97_025852 [Dioscorea zingiberensis]|uniref:GDSL esterase/lipase n=1 Tax=Dioscorea zingiberensis TaxID=325984 RepID=A0A9D5H609_9LILI|nr:hypothetical protein J5N97_025852 [Dioscorea zingiberensis]
MAANFELKIMLYSSTAITFLFIFTSLIPSFQAHEVEGMFVFGSSLVDNGNNNYLRNSSARADYIPYGIDFPLGPSGRFSNGRNPIDVLGELLRLPSFIPPFSDPSTVGQRILHGVNYASGGSGILDHTGSITGEVTSMNQQIRNFEKVTLAEMQSHVDLKRKCDHLSKYLFIVGTGGNDYLLNYFTSNNRRTNILNFTHKLIATLSRQLRRLYDLGARKFVLFSIQAMGCIPAVRANLHVSNGSCVEAMNEAALLFNNHLKALVTKSPNSSMPHASMIYINSYKIIRDIIKDPISNGFKETSKACCDLPSNGILCRKGGKACKDRNSHVFFDGLHPTDAVNERIAHIAYASNLKSEAYPTNVKNLVQMYN